MSCVVVSSDLPCIQPDPRYNTWQCDRPCKAWQCDTTHNDVTHTIFTTTFHGTDTTNDSATFLCLIITSHCCASGCTGVSYRVSASCCHVSYHVSLWVSRVTVKSWHTTFNLALIGLGLTRYIWKISISPHSKVSGVCKHCAKHMTTRKTGFQLRSYWLTVCKIRKDFDLFITQHFSFHFSTFPQKAGGTPLLPTTKTDSPETSFPPH